MIPLKLQIKNFLSYGSPSQLIDFTPYNLICLSGKNGHGKSALLDALTWAIWGQARKIPGTSKADEGLLRLGQTNMVVSLDFMCNGYTYRVRREFTYNRNKGIVQLDFGIEDTPTRFRSLTDKTIRTTQAKIEQVIGLDFESFINSAFLRQGSSNEFSKKSPKERKEILANILGLNTYELLRKQALEKIKTGGMSKAHLTQTCTRLNLEIEQELVQKNRLIELQAYYKTLEQQEKTIYENKQAHITEHKNIQEQLAQLTQTKFQYTQLQTIYKEQCEQFHTIVTQFRSICREQHATPSMITQERKQHIEAELATLQTILAQRLALTNAIMQLKERKLSIVAQFQEKHHQQQQQYVEQLHILEKKLQAEEAEFTTRTNITTELQRTVLTLQTEHTQLLPQAAQIDTLHKQLAQQESAFERRKSFYHKFVAHGNRLTQELKQIAHKKELALDTQRPSCSLCNQHLSAQHRTQLHQKLIVQEQIFQHQIKRLTHVIKNIKDTLTQEHQRIQTQKQLLETSKLAAQKIDDIQIKVAQHTHTVHEKLAALKTIAQIIQDTRLSLQQKQSEKKLSFAQADAYTISDEFQTLEKQLRTHEQTLAQQQYDQQHYEILQQELTRYHAQQTAHTELMKQINLQSERKQTIQKYIQAIRATKLQLQQFEARIQQLIPVYEAQQKLELLEQELTVQLQMVVQKKEQLAHQCGALEQECLRIEKQKELLHKERTCLQTLETDISEYQFLSHALSKDGIQGLLIENALPEIEEEANAVLTKLTNNQAHILIESLKDLKSGGTKETLDIKISDAMGIRPYELFSGGEAFRIDFSLRLAISKLLARRAGASLQTLIIDEGFGSQDDEGLSNIMESLYAIQDNFAKIIIVSHLPTMKDQFPVHFCISKDPRGSVVEVVEQG